MNSMPLQALFVPVRLRDIFPFFLLAVSVDRCFENAFLPACLLRRKEFSSKCRTATKYRVQTASLD